MLGRRLRVVSCMMAAMVLAALVGCGGGKSREPEGKTVDDLIRHFKKSGLGVKVADDIQYKTGPTWKDAKGHTVGIGLGIYRIFKFNLKKNAHEIELARLKKEGKVEISRAAPGLKQPVLVNGPFIIIPLPPGDMSDQVRAAFNSFDPNPGPPAGTAEKEDAKAAPKPVPKDVKHDRGVLKKTK